jgi:hypothetical protein
MSAPRSLLRLAPLAAAAALGASCESNPEYIQLTTPVSICVAPGETVTREWQVRVAHLQSATATAESEAEAEGQGKPRSFSLQTFEPVPLPVHGGDAYETFDFTIVVTGVKPVSPTEQLVLAVRGRNAAGPEGRANLVPVEVSEACRRGDGGVVLPPPADAAAPPPPDADTDGPDLDDGPPELDSMVADDGPGSSPEVGADAGAAPEDAPVAADLAPAPDAGLDLPADLPPAPDTSEPDTAPPADAATPDAQPDVAPDLAPDLAADTAPDVAPDLSPDMMVVLPPGADLAVTLSQMSTASAPLHPGDKVTITALVRNNGPEAAMFSWVDLTWPGTRFSRDTTVNAQGVTLPPGAQIFSQSSTLDEISFNSIAVGATYEVKWHFVVQALASPETAMTSAVVAASGPADMVQPNNQSALSTSLAP